MYTEDNSIVYRGLPDSSIGETLMQNHTFILPHIQRSECKSSYPLYQ